MEQSNGFMDKLAKLIKDFSMSKFMPKLDSVLGWIELITRLAVMAAPVVVLILGLIYFFIPPKEANHSLGYRFYWGMGSVDAWRFTQKIAGLSWSVAGLVLSLVMFLITNGYRGMELMAMVQNAVKCLLWQIGILLVLCLLIDLVVLLRYDWRGNVRPKTIIRVPDNFLEFRKRPAKTASKDKAPKIPANAVDTVEPIPVAEEQTAEPVPVAEPRVAEPIPVIGEQAVVESIPAFETPQAAESAPEAFAPDENPIDLSVFEEPAPSVEAPPQPEMESTFVFDSAPDAQQPNS